MKKIAVTLGDPNGISPEITIKALNFLDLPKDKVVLIANKNVLDLYEEKYDLYLEKEYEIVEIPYAKEDVKVGVETEEAGEVVILKVEDTDSEDEESYVGVEDQEVLNAVFAIFKDKFKDEFNFVD